VTGARGCCFVVFYHYVRDARRTAFPAVNALAVADFLRQVDHLRSVRPIIDHATLEAAFNGGLPLPGSSVLLTFDDGFVEHYTTVYPALRDRGLRGTFFITGAGLASPPRLLAVHKTHFLLAKLGAQAFATDVRERLSAGSSDLGGRQQATDVYRYDGDVESATKHLLNYELAFGDADRILEELFRKHIGDSGEFAAALYLSHDMVREMADAGMTFGFHTQNHRVLSRLSRAEQRGEIAHGVQLVRELTEQSSVPFCYPYGHPHTYNADTLAILAEAGYSMAFTTVRRAADPVSDARFELPRFDTRDLLIAAGEQVDA
jgi:peptidoglycan/xylan/chitin deacetylase (PgdA/CDA1 family)